MKKLVTSKWLRGGMALAVIAALVALAVSPSSAQNAVTCVRFVVSNDGSISLEQLVTTPPCPAGYQDTTKGPPTAPSSTTTTEKVTTTTEKATTTTEKATSTTAEATTTTGANTTSSAADSTTTTGADTTSSAADSTTTTGADTTSSVADSTTTTSGETTTTVAGDGSNPGETPVAKPVKGKPDYTG